MEFSYTTALEDLMSGLKGNVSVSALGSYVNQFLTFDGTTTLDSAGEARQPHWTWDFDVRYNNGPVTLSTSINRLGTGYRNNQFKGTLDTDNNFQKEVWYVGSTLDVKTATSASVNRRSTSTSATSSTGTRPPGARSAADPTIALDARSNWACASSTSGGRAAGDPSPAARMTGLRSPVGARQR